MKNEIFIDLVQNTLKNIRIIDYNSGSYISKIRLNDCLTFYKRMNSLSDKKYYFTEIKRLLKEFNLNLNLNFNQIEF